MVKLYMLLLAGCSLYLNGADPDPMDGIEKIEADLFKACKAGDLGAVNHLLKDSESMQTLINTYDSGEKATPVHIAAKHGHFAIIKTLHHAGFQLNQCPFQITPLVSAIMHKQEKVALQLIGLGIPVDLKDKNDDTYLHYAVNFQLKNVVEVLLQKNVSLFSKNKGRETALDLARTHEEIKKLLLFAMDKEIMCAKKENRALR